MKAVVCFATGYEEVEALAVVDVLRRAGIEVIMAGVRGMSVSSSRKISINMDMSIDEVVWDTVDMIVLPGGLPGVDHLYDNEVVKQQVIAFKEQEKWIGAICAAPSILGKLGVAKGETLTCYPGFEDTLEGAIISKERVVKSNKIITGVGAGASLEFAFMLLEVLQGEDVAKKLKQSMLVN